MLVPDAYNHTFNNEAIRHAPLSVRDRMLMVLLVVIVAVLVRASWRCIFG
jgi:hypothetical protein